MPHSIKLNGFYELPFGRGKRFGTDWHPVVDGIAGGWSLSMTGRMQTRTLSIGDAVLVGMTVDDLQSEYKFRIDDDLVVRMLPDDIILNTQRAFDTSATSPTGYGPLGAPTGRYIRPASEPGCVRVRPGDCGEPEAIFLSAPLFTRFDLSLKKQIPVGGRKTVDLQFDINNLFGNINFDAGVQSEQRDALPDERDLHGHQPVLRSGRTAGADDRQVQLVDQDSRSGVLGSRTGSR